MLSDKLEDRQRYLKPTLLACLLNAKKTTGLKIPRTNRTVILREQAGIRVYLRAQKDPTNGYTIYTGRQIKNIVAYEIKRRKS